MPDFTSNLRSSSKGTLIRVLADSREGICDDSHEQIDQPEVENDDAHDEKEARDEELRVHHGIHQR